MTLEEAQARYPPMWVIYDHPLDYPQYFVVRVFYGETPGPVVGFTDTLGSARSLICDYGGSVSIGRYPEDDPVITEVWI